MCSDKFLTALQHQAQLIVEHRRFTKNFQEAGVFVQIVFESADSRHIFVVEGHHQNVEYPLNRQNCANARYTQITTQ